ncbi:ATP-binding protein [Dyadobacter sp. CY261]|uniref:sensor histidine kinase n=1 Tax=Dyadobacter sp. CY261 TaxID=2907203 RepID=UPI001F411390|nr:ATP-binding protein [Dyadobacter sp. CY261]MCF0069453.1 ATP-binding protein [Dyadobacter sp. CY261]
MNITPIFSFLLFLTIAGHVFSQEIADFTEQHYTSDNGLPQNSVMQLQKDKNGFIWMTTQGGLVRFDGMRFVTFNLSNVPQLTSNRIIELGLTGDSTIYFKDTSFKVFSFDQNNQPFVLNPHIRNRYVILQSREKQLDVIRNLHPQDRHRIESLFAPFATGIIYQQIGAPGDGFLRIGDNLLFYLSQKRIVFSKTFENSSAMSYNNAGVLNGRIYFFNDKKQLACIDSSGREQAVSFGITSPDKKGFRGPSHFYQQGKRLFLHNANTFYELLPTAGSTDRRPSTTGALICKPVLKTADLGSIYCYLNIPESGIHMIGTGTGGLYVFKKKQFKTVRIPGTNNNFYSQHLYRNNGLLTEPGAILPNGTVTGEPFPLVARSGILVDKQGYVWINTPGKKVEQRTADLKLVRKFNAEREVAKFAQTTDGTIWLSLMSGKLGRISGDSIQWIKLEKGIKSFLPIDNSHFWTSDGHGAYLLNTQNSSLKELSDLKGKEIRVFYSDKRRTLWAGTYGQGFYAVRNGRATALPLDRNGYLLVVHTFLEDNRGFLWMSTNHGLFKCKMQDLYDYLDHKTTHVFYYYYDKSNGFGNNEFNGGCDPSAVIFPDGKFSFPSMDGLVQVYPDSLTDILPDSRILIDKFIVDGKEQPLSTDLELTPSFNRIEVLLASPYFGLPENQVLEYNIKGLDDEWYRVNNSLTITLNRLDYGDYVLQVRKKTGFGAANVGLLTKNFTIKPFWYQTWYFTAFSFALLVFSFYLVVKLRYHYLTLQKKQLEAQVRERTIQLEYSNRLKEKITLLLAHDLQSPLHFLNLLSDHVADSLEKNRLDEVITGMTEIRKAATNIHAFIKEINLWTKSQQEGFQLSKRPFPFDDLADELREFFKEMLHFKNNTLEFVNPGQWHLFTNREILKAVIRNLIDNSNKHTSGGRITVELDKLDEKYLRLSVTDNGGGISPADLSKINRRIGHVLTTAGIEQSSRLGYQIIIDFVARLDCKLDVKSIVGKGTTVTITGRLTGKTDTEEALLTDITPSNLTTL